MAFPLGFVQAGKDRELYRNFIGHVVEGGLYIGGLAFVHPHTVLPRMLQALGAPSLLVAFAPSLLMIGFILPGLFVAHRIEQLPKMRGWVVRLGVWQRLPYLLAALLLLLSQRFPALALPTVLLAPVVSGLVGGVAVNAWKEYVASTIPDRLRASLWALRFVVGTVIGFAAGGLVTYVLTHHPGAPGYALLHLGTFVLAAASFVVFLGTNEAPGRPRASQQSLGEFISGVPALVRSDRRFLRYLCARVPLHGVFVLLPFIGIHALKVLSQPDAFLGKLLAFNLFGSLIGYLAAGYLGDRYGGRLSMLLAHIAWLGAAAAAPLVASPAGFEWLFFALGAGLSMSAVGCSTLDLEITPLERRVSFQAVLGTVTLVGLVMASLLAALLRRLTESIWALAVPAFCITLVSLVLYWSIEEPRSRRAL